MSSDSVVIQTDSLSLHLPQVEINSNNAGSIKPGFNLVNYFGHNGDFLPQRPFMFDEFGDIRWYLDYTDHPILSNLFFDNGINRLANGNMVFGNGSTDFLYEINMFGEVINEWSLQGYGFHHTVIEKPNGNFLATVNDPSKPTFEDVILEIDRTNGNIINQWDLNESLDSSRTAWETNVSIAFDWFHANGIVYSPSDDCIIVSGRVQGTVKLNAENEVVWILAPHREWEISGNGTDLNQFLLQPLDAQGLPIVDQQVLEGEVNHPDFEWAWYQHSPIILSNGHVMLFDNGFNRNYSSMDKYSRAVEYEVDEVYKTIRQVWSYGKERGEETYSWIVSKVVYHEKENNVLFTSGAVKLNGGLYGKVIEVDKQSGQVLFEATVIPPANFTSITFHNVLRMGLYR